MLDLQFPAQITLEISDANFLFKAVHHTILCNLQLNYSNAKNGKRTKYSTRDFLALL